MVSYGMQPDNIRSVRLGIASHNLFELAYGLVLTLQNNAFEYVQFEMLEGMANHQRRAMFELCDNLLLYAPACKKKDFIHAIGYLVRRLDENTGPDNFLRHAFRLEVAFARLATTRSSSSTTASSAADWLASRVARRTARQQPAEPHDETPWQQFRNEPNTDFALPQNVEWAKQLIARWIGRHGDAATNIPLTIAGAKCTTSASGRMSGPVSSGSRHRPLPAGQPRRYRAALDCAARR